MTAELDKEFTLALIQSLMSADPKELIQMMQGTKLDFKASIEDIPLEIGIRIKAGEILARVKFPQEEKQEDGDQPETG